MNLWNFLAVGAGGALGAMARYGTHKALNAWHGAEGAWSTFGINVIGALALGLAVGFLAHRDSHLSLFVRVGFCGAFTTFSTFALDMVVLFRDRGFGVSALYISLSVFLGLVAFLIGLALSRGNLG